MKEILLLSSDVSFSRMLCLELATLHTEIRHLPDEDMRKTHDGFHAETVAAQACTALKDDRAALLLIDLDSPLGEHMIEKLLTLAKEKNKPVILFGSPATPLLNAEKYRYYDSEITRYVFIRPFLMEQFLYCTAQLLYSENEGVQAHTVPHAMKMKQHAAADDIRLQGDTHTAFYKNEKIALTPTEFEVIALLLQHRGEVLSREQIFSSLSDDGKVSRAKQGSNLVDVYIRFLRQKLEVPFGIRFIETVRGVGYMISID